MLYASTVPAKRCRNQYDPANRNKHQLWFAELAVVEESNAPQSSACVLGGMHECQTLLIKTEAPVFLHGSGSAPLLHGGSAPSNGWFCWQHNSKCTWRGVPDHPTTLERLCFVLIYPAIPKVSRQMHIHVYIKRIHHKIVNMNAAFDMISQCSQTYVYSICIFHEQSEISTQNISIKYFPNIYNHNQLGLAHTQSLVFSS